MDLQPSEGTFKRKKKRMSTYQRAVKYSKRGKFGHGFQIQDEDFQYFLNILKVSKETFECDEDKRNLYYILTLFSAFRTTIHSTYGEFSF